MRYRELYEATRPFVKKMVDPALMTFGEYLKIIDPENKSHPSTAYDSDVKDLNSYDNAGNYQKLLNTVTVNGIVFEVRQQQIDAWDNRYIKTDQNGDIVRDENGMATYLSKDEIAKLIPPQKRYTYDFAVVRKDTGEIVGRTQDEWGTLLVMVAQEYRNFGFGTLLVKLKREREPTKPSGGFTNAGFNNIRRVHTQMVRDYLASGMYSHLVNTRVLTAKRAKEIINSIGEKKTTPKQRNLNTNNPEDWLIMTDAGDSYAILYDKKIFELDDEFMDSSYYWMEKFIIGMVAIGGPEDFFFIDRRHGSDRIVSKLTEVLLNGDSLNPIYLEKDMAARVKNNIGASLNIEPVKKENRTMYKCWLDNRTVDLTKIMRLEKVVRQKNDPYGEVATRIQEIAESLAE